MNPSDPHPPLRTFGRIKSRTIKPAQGALLDTLLPQIAMPTDRPLDRETLLADRRELWLEIGFGGGEHLAGQAARRPDVTLIGAEPFLNGAASALRHIDEAGLSNVRLHVGDARDIVDALPDASLDRVFILFPDPWPKLRHHKRRLIQPGFVADLARVLAPGGTASLRHGLGRLCGLGAGAPDRLPRPGLDGAGPRPLADAAFGSRDHPLSGEAAGGHRPGLSGFHPPLTDRHARAGTKQGAARAPCQVVSKGVRGQAGDRSLCGSASLAAARSMDSRIR